jgi:hypothetical protein
MLRARGGLHSSPRKFGRTWQALVAVLAVAACDPNVVIGSKFRVGSGGSTETGGSGAPATSGTSTAGLGGVPAGGSTAGDTGVPAGGPNEGGVGGQADDGLIFTADHENGVNLTQWDEGPDSDAGGYYADPDAELPSYSTERAHSGNGSAKVTIDSTSGEGVIARLYRRIANDGAAYYSAWFYLEEDHTPDGWWSIFLFRAVQDRNQSVDLWSVDLVRTAADKLTVAVYDHANQKTLAAPGNPEVPVGQWFQLQAYLQVAPNQRSQLGLWLDGNQFLELSDATPPPADQPLYWVVGNGSARLNPPISTLFVDDAQISTSFVRP